MAGDDVDHKAGALERLMRGSCIQRGHMWVKQNGKDGPVCLRCGLRVTLPAEVKTDA